MRTLTVLLIGCALLAAACGERAPAAAGGSATATTATATASGTVTATASGTPAPSPSATGTATLAPTTTPAATATATPGEATRAILPGQPLRLGVGERVRLPGGGTLSLRAVLADSRCPVDVTCIRAGDAQAVFALTDTGGALHEVTVLVAPARGEAMLTAAGLRLRVLDLRPAPRSTAAIAPGDYVATVVVDAAGATSSGAFGLVTVGPTCPVERVDQPCPDRPLAATLVIEAASGREVARATASVDGFYAVGLVAGHYTIVPLTPGGGILPRGTPLAIDIAGGDWTLADVSYDSGIR